MQTFGLVYKASTLLHRKLVPFALTSKKDIISQVPRPKEKDCGYQDDQGWQRLPTWLCERLEETLPVHCCTLLTTIDRALWTGTLDIAVSPKILICSLTKELTTASLPTAALLQTATLPQIRPVQRRSTYFSPLWHRSHIHYGIYTTTVLSKHLPRAASSCMVYKTSEVTPLHGEFLVKIFTEVGLPPGVFNVVYGAGDVGAYLTSYPKIAKVSFMGQVSTGQKVAAATAGGMKYVTMELGGKNTLIILPDADLGNAVDGRMMANVFSTRTSLHKWD
jgi:hypothetical protein